VCTVIDCVYVCIVGIVCIEMDLEVKSIPAYLRVALRVTRFKLSSTEAAKH